MAIEARGGVLGGADGPSGQLVLVRLDGPVLEVFDETDGYRFHAAFVQQVGLVEHPSAVGSALVVRAARRGITIPVRFEGEELTRLRVITESLRDVP